MLSHVHIGVTEFERSLDFYSALMEALGYPLRFCEAERSWAGWQPRDAPRPLLLIGRAFNGIPATPGNGQMIALLAEDRPAVDRAFSRAMAAGAISEGEPGLRAQYHEHYYGAYFRDPDGNKICVCCHDLASST